MEIHAIWLYKDEEKTLFSSAYRQEKKDDGTLTNGLLEQSMTLLKEKILFEDFIENSGDYAFEKGPVGLFTFDNKPALYFHAKFPPGYCVVIGSDEMANLPIMKKTLLIRNILAKGRALQEVISDPIKYSTHYHRTQEELDTINHPKPRPSTEKRTSSTKACNFTFALPCFSR